MKIMVHTCQVEKKQISTSNFFSAVFTDSQHHSITSPGTNRKTLKLKRMCLFVCVDSRST